MIPEYLTKAPTFVAHRFRPSPDRHDHEPYSLVFLPALFETSIGQGISMDIS
jgi:hypothetical protein